MMHMPEIVGYLSILTDEEVKTFVVISFDKSFNSAKSTVF